MTHLIIVSGPSGVGKNSLIDKLDIPYFKKVMTRPKRAEDRDEEANFISEEEFKELESKVKIAIPYQLRGNQYGIPITSLAALKSEKLVCALGNFDLIESLRATFTTTTVYVIANQEEIKRRLERREDTDEQRRKSIDAIPEHLADYERRVELFDYEITNDDLGRAQNELARIVEFETKPKKFGYQFLVPTMSASRAQEEIEREGGFYTLLPKKEEITQVLGEEFGEFLSTSFLGSVNKECHNGRVKIELGVRKDRERDYISYGRISVIGVPNEAKRVCQKIEELLPAINHPCYTQGKGTRSGDRFRAPNTTAPYLNHQP